MKSNTQIRADYLRHENSNYNVGVWNVFNMSNRQILKLFGSQLGKNWSMSKQIKTKKTKKRRKNADKNRR